MTNDLSSMFRRLSWKSYSAEGKKDRKNQQISYITDKDIYAYTKSVDPEGEDLVDVLYTKKSAFSKDVTIEQLYAIAHQLVPGIYITSIETEGVRNGVLYYYMGDAEKEEDGKEYFKGTWLRIASTSEILTIITSVNNLGPDKNGNVTLKANNILTTVEKPNGNYYNIDEIIKDILNTCAGLLIQEHQQYDPNVYNDNGASNTYTNYKRGNIQISGYFEGRMDGGGW